MRNIMLQFIGVLALAGCSSSQVKTTCATHDWFELGRQDGAAGRVSRDVSSLTKRCPASQPDPKLYQNGWNSGIAEFCSPENGYAMGKSGYPYKESCPSVLQETFFENYQLGKKALGLEKTNRAISFQLRRLTQELAKKELPKVEKQKLGTRIQQLKQKLAQNKSELTRIEGSVQ